MPALATDALLPEQKKNSAIGAGLLFPSRKNPSRPITSHLAGYWLKRAFEIGTLPKARPQLFGIDSGESGRRTGGIFR